MSRFMEGLCVVTVEGGKLRHGIIESLYGELGVATVRFTDTNCIQKVRISNLAVDPGMSAETKSEEKPSEPVEKSEITITPDEFRRIASNTAAELATELAERSKRKEMELIYSLEFAIFSAKLHETLFVGSVEN